MATKDNANKPYDYVAGVKKNIPLTVLSVLALLSSLSAWSIVGAVLGVIGAGLALGTATKTDDQDSMKVRWILGWVCIAAVVIGAALHWFIAK